MLLHRRSGIGAAFATRELPSPPVTPAKGTATTASATATSANAAGTSKILPELGPAVLDDGEIAAYVEANDEPVRVYYWRDPRVKPVVGLEVYAGFLSVAGEQPWSKVFAIGTGVKTGPGSVWHIDADLGPPAGTLAETPACCVKLDLYRCHLRPGADLGDGYIKTSDVASVDDSAPVCTFRWTYCTPVQLKTLGLGLGNIQPRLSAQQGADPLSIRIAAAGPQPPTNELEPALDFLRHTNRLLLGLLTEEQKRQFAEILGHSYEAQRLLTPVQLGELLQAGQPGLTSSPDTSLSRSEATESPQPLSSVPAKKRKADPLGAVRPRQSSGG
ncbi:hypothetical protein BMF94_5725 [Rhodotorula taiwanensis]|uniref:Uncharacterized protein n=1 Tax=Rhodotorula taiwanensis TaxID=741276 RepID=A0A2S5B3Q1_9BASI|nr:hypothetical protein BMF94_5725 [Rhodotorula taiwanensis]